MSTFSQTIFRSRGRLPKMIRADGGLFRIMLKLDENDAEKLGRLRELCGRTTAFTPVKYIPLFYNMPVRQQVVYESTLLRSSRRLPFTINVNHPFKPAGQRKLTTKFRILFDVSSPQLSEIGQDLELAFKDIRELSSPKNEYWVKRRPPALDPRFTLLATTDLDDLHRKFEFAQQNYKNGVRSVTAVGLTLQFEPFYSEDSIYAKIHRQDRPRPPPQDFLFREVDENVGEGERRLNQHRP